MSPQAFRRLTMAGFVTYLVVQPVVMVALALQGRLALVAVMAIGYAFGLVAAVMFAFYASWRTRVERRNARRRVRRVRHG